MMYKRKNQKVLNGKKFGIFLFTLLMAISFMSDYAAIPAFGYENPLETDSDTQGSIENMPLDFVYYSSVSKAVADANTLTAANADVHSDDKTQAEAALYLDGNHAEILLLKDTANIPSLTLQQNTTLTLGNHILNFAPAAYLTYTKDLTIREGTIKSTDSNYTVFGTKDNLNSTFTLSNVQIEEIITADAKATAIAADSSSKAKHIANVKIQQRGKGNTQYAANALILRNDASINTINNTSVDIHVDNTLRVRGLQLQGTTEINNINITVTTATGTAAYGIYSYGTTSIAGANIYAESINEKTGAGIAALNGSLYITSTEEQPVICYGKEWGIQTAPDETIIHGGIYTSTDHTAYISNNAEIYNAQFYVANRDKYSTNSMYPCSGFYLGGSKCTEEAVVNLYNCTFGNPAFTEQNYNAALTTTLNYGYYQPKEINLYNCDIYTGINMFCYNHSSPNDTTMQKTKFNLYGNTRLFEKYSTTEKAWQLYSNDEIAKQIATWKTHPVSSTTRYSVGGGLIIGLSCATIDPDTLTVNNLRILDEANVYDYRYL